MDTLLFYLRLPWSIMFYSFNLFGYKVSYGLLFVFIIFVDFLFWIIYKLFD